MRRVLAPPQLDGGSGDGGAAVDPVRAERVVGVHSAAPTGRLCVFLTRRQRQRERRVAHLRSVEVVDPLGERYGAPASVLEVLIPSPPVRHTAIAS